MRRWNIIVLALATGIVLFTSVATAGPSATKQRAAITARGTAPISSIGRFVLEPGAGALEYDSGTETSVVARQRSVTRDEKQSNVPLTSTRAAGLRTGGTSRFTRPWKQRKTTTLSSRR
jgi:hypothetical protein